MLFDLTPDEVRFLIPPHSPIRVTELSLLADASRPPPTLPQTLHQDVPPLRTHQPRGIFVQDPWDQGRDQTREGGRAKLAFDHGAGPFSRSQLCRATGFFSRCIPLSSLLGLGLIRLLSQEVDAERRDPRIWFLTQRTQQQDPKCSVHCIEQNLERPRELRELEEDLESTGGLEVERLLASIPFASRHSSSQSSWRVRWTATSPNSPALPRPTPPSPNSSTPQTPCPPRSTSTMPRPSPPSSPSPPRTTSSRTSSPFPRPLRRARGRRAG